MPHSSPTEPRKPLTVPPFSSTLPESLLTGLSSHEHQLYIASDEMRQTIQWMANTLANTANRIEDVHEQASKTNGRVTAIEEDMRAVRTEQAEAAPHIRTIETMKTVAKNRWFWAGAALFLFVLVPYIAAHVPPGKAWDVLVSLVAG